VGGWGSATFQEGFSSSTVDGGKNWQNADEIKFINRFRFFYQPVIIGYASGRTVYRYSAEPVVAPHDIAAVEKLHFFADNTPQSSTAPMQISLTIPDGAARVNNRYLGPIWAACPSTDRRDAARDRSTYR